MENNKLKIRIQIQQQPPQAIDEIYPDLPEPEVTYEEVLDWRKISIAALILLPILILIGYLLFADKNNEKSRNEPPPVDSIISEPENKASLDKTEPLTGSSDKASETQSDELKTQQNAPDDSKETTVASKAIATPIKKPESATVINQPAITGIKIPKTARQSKPQKTSDHPEVARAQLSHAIEEREPVDSIDAIQLHPGESQSIHFYLHLKNLQGKNIRINWYHDDKLDSQLALQVHNNNWRTHASKQLDHRRLGPWRVELVDESGNLLAARSFTVSQH
ncbi:DUF2914 domain-containing protein [Nitrosomonas sp.]|uniref:DUF2914 domain-containing protein n=1 Tax=Nitrosomonas sp. TaxID=42353 RepID=UPI0025E27C7C|nr:DUF2914 domain-containing protein [Nitrosomonas sp.]